MRILLDEEASRLGRRALRRLPDDGSEPGVPADLSKLSIAVLVVRAPSNRIEDLLPLVPAILLELERVEPKSLRHVGG